MSFLDDGAETGPYCTTLLEYNTRKNLPAPDYVTMGMKGGFGASVNYKSGIAMSGAVACKTRSEAKERAACEALMKITNEIHPQNQGKPLGALFITCFILLTLCITILV